MAILTTVFVDALGEEKEIYVRINNIESNNHGAESRALLRGYASETAFKEHGAGFIWEKSIPFTADITQPIWQQVYQASGLVGTEA